MRTKDFLLLNRVAADMAAAGGAIGTTWLQTQQECLNYLVLKFGGRVDQDAVCDAEWTKSLV